MLSFKCYIHGILGGLFLLAFIVSTGLAQSLENGDFSLPLKPNGTPPGWTFYSWPSGARPEGIAIAKDESGSFVNIPATKKDPVGIVSAPIDITPYRNGLRVEFEARRSADFTGNRAWTFVTWNNESKCIGRFDLGVPTLAALTTEWKSFRVEIPPSEIPENAVKLAVNLATHEYQSVGGLAGTLAFRRVKISPVDLRESGPPKLKLTLAPAKVGSWWTLGEPAVFTLANGQFPVNVSAIEGRITNVRGEKIATVSVPKADVISKGWSWKASEPGYYEARFFGLTSTGEFLPLAPEQLKLNAPNGATSNIPYDRFPFVVMSTRLPDVGHGGQVGFSYLLNPESIPLAQLVGLDFALIHSIGWGAHFTKLEKALEPEKGVYRWELLDPHVEALSKANIEMVGNINYTPVWASPHPEEANQIDVCVRRATAYAPKDMNDFRNFMEKVVTRYKDRIKIWEIWNEPNMPGSSCFWADTPANYVKLLQAGYETIKKVQPDSEVWLGGLGARANYHSFYWNVLRLGAGPYYDTLSLHGSWNNETPYRRIEQSLNAKPRPIVNSEWHGILCGNFQKGPFPSETALSERMIKDYLQQLRGGVQRTILFEILNLVEIEELDFAVEQRWFLNSSGIFRKRPRPEPRHAAIVMATLLNLTGKKSEYVNEYALSGTGSAVQLKTKRGELLVLWVDTAAKAREVLGGLIGKDSTLCDWESKPLNPASAETTFLPGTLYFLSAPESKTLAGLKPARVLINPREQQQQSLPVPEAPLLATELYKAGKNSNAETFPVTQDWHWTTALNTAKSKPLTARAVVSSHANGLDVIVEVTDPLHVQNEATNRLWYGDSLQLAIDCEENGLVGGNTEFAIALTAQGPVVMKIAAAELRGDLPGNWSPAGQPARFVQCQIARSGNKTLYQLRFPWSELFPLTYTAGKSIRVGLVVNENDGSGRVGYLEWGNGIGGDKNPSLYGKLIPAK
ncbi:MAG: hypothetical protein B9S32_05055 [Verrucomicrobia bacterium Tous-C9LFEB]|nr:MAG: hypothetical protein B9S32_05055 [Verrucomicrobia bacterium Tous-C9LFEB]